MKKSMRPLLAISLLFVASPLVAQSSKVDSVARQDSLIASDTVASRPMPGRDALGHCVMLPQDLEKNCDAWRREQR
jgi:hypothetical protein